MSLTNQSIELNELKISNQNNNNIDINNDKTQYNNNSDDESVKNINANFFPRISIKSFQDNDQSSIDSEIVSSSNTDEFALQSHSSESSNIPLNHVIGICNDINYQGNGFKVNNLAIQNSNDVTIGNKTIYTGPVTINQFLPNEINHHQKKYDDNDCDNCGKFENNVIDSRKTGDNQNKVFSRFEVFYKSSSDKERISKKSLIILTSIFLLIIIFIIIGIASVLLIKPGTTKDISPESWNIRIINRTEWGAKQPNEELEPFAATPFRVIIAHTASEECTTESSCKLRVKFIQNVMMDNGYDDIGYNFLVGGDGMVYEGCGWNKVGIHTKGFNNNSIGIAFMGNFMLIKPHIQQLKAAEWILDECVKNGKLIKDYKLYGARQVNPTLSPGDELYKIIKTWTHWTDEIE